MRKPSGPLIVLCIIALFIFIIDYPRRKNQIKQNPNILRGVTVRAYCPCEDCCGPHANGRTAIGDNARICDGVAADFKIFPKRTQLRIPGIGVREVDDTGGALRQNAKRGIVHIDVRFPTHREALEWGVRKLDVTVLTTLVSKR
jgi:3D (Asp-Asp-Asp) domain-containing protein